MGGFFGNIIGSVISRLMIMVAVVGGGKYFMSGGGGLSGVMGGDTPVSIPQPISAGMGGLGAIASSLGIGTSKEKDYFEVQGRISAIRVECRLVREKAGKMTRTEPVSCERARTALSYPQFAGYSVTETRTATYIYYDLDGVNVLKGKANARHGQNVGDVIGLRVNRDDPRKSTPI